MVTRTDFSLEFFENFLIVFLFFVGIFFVSSVGFVSAEPINDTISLNIQTTWANGTVIPGPVAYSFFFNITTSSLATCVSPVYNHRASVTTDARGIASIYLPTISSEGQNLSTLDYDQQYYMCYYRDGVLKDVFQLATVPYSFKTQRINLSEVVIDSNLTLGDYNISASSGFFSFLGSLTNRITSLFVQDVESSGYVNVSGDVVSGGNVSVTGNVTASWFRGIFDWIIGESSQNYLSFNGTQLDFDESVLNNTIDTKISVNNVSVNNYIAENNQSIVNYIAVQNGSLVNYIAVNNQSLNNYIAENNLSVNDYILYVNSTNTGLPYEDAWINETIYNKTQIEEINLSVNNYITENNLSVNNYITYYVGIQNGSLVNYIAVQNGSLVNYIGIVNASVNNNIVASIIANNNSVNNYISDNNASVNNYISENNGSVTNWVNDVFVKISNIIDLVGNWSADKTSYYTKTEADATNTSNNNYILSNNQSVNNYIAENNVSVVNYVDGQDISFNQSVNNYISENNLSVNNYIVDYVGVQNDSLRNYLLGYIVVQNGSLVNYIAVVNESMKNYVDYQDLEFNNSVNNNIVASILTNNNSVNNYITQNNNSVNNYIVDYVGIQNTSLVNYINVVNTTRNNYVASVNTSMRNYVGVQNTSLVNYISVVNTTRNNYVTDTFVPYTGGTKDVNLGNHTFRVNESAFFVNGSSGNVGIGTTGPNVPLEVVGRGRMSIVQVGTTATINDATGVAATLQFANSAMTAPIASSADVYIYKTTSVAGSYPFTAGNAGTLVLQGRSSGASGDIAFLTGDSGANKMVIKNSGNVGIGTTAPSYKLDVAGNVNAYGLKINGTSVYTTTEVDAINTSMKNYVDYQDSWYNTSVNNYITQNNNSVNNYITQNNVSVNNNIVASILTNNNSVNNYIVNYVGIQNTSVVNWVSNTFNATRNNYVGVVNTSMRNYVGVQNTSLVNYIGVVNTTRNNYVMDMFVPYTGATKNVVLGANNFSVDTSVFFVDKNNDRVGIGTTAPGAKLEVVGSANITGFSITDDSLVTLANGSKKKIKDIAVGEDVLTLDEETGKLVVKKVNALLDHGVKQIYEMTTVTGKAINTTAEHPYLAKSNSKEDYLRSLNRSEVENILIFDCFLNAFSSDQTGQSADSARAKYMLSFVCGDNFEASDKKCLYSDSGEILISSFNNKNNSANVSLLMPENFLTLSSSLESSSSTKSGDINLHPELSSSSKSTLLVESDLKNENRMLASITKDFGSGIFYNPCSFVTLSFNPSASLFACSSVNFDLESKESAIMNLTRLVNCSTTLVKAASNSGFNSGEMLTLNKISDFSILSNELKEYIKLSQRNETENKDYARWVEVQYLKVGDEIAVPDYRTGGIKWEKIALIRVLDEQHVYDLNIEGTRNFIANDIVAHNTYINGVNVTEDLVPYTGSDKNVVLGNYNFSVGTSDFFVNANGNVGIGTTGPSYKLDVAGNVNAYKLMVNGTAVNGNTTGAGTANYVSKWLSGSQLGSSVIYDNGTYVGIGTTTPNTLLTLNQAPGEWSDNPTLSFGDGDTGFYETADDTLDLSIATILRYSWSSTAFTGTTNYGFSLLRGAGSAATPSYSFVGDEDTGIYRDSADYLRFSTGATHRMTIDDSGNVGIGTTLPNSKLEVNGTFNATSNGASIRIDSGGNVIIAI